MARGRFADDSGAIWGAIRRDPISLTAVTAASMAATAAGGAISAAGTLAGGNYAEQAGQMQKTAADFQAQQLNENASQAIAAGQRKMLDTQERTRLAISTNTARAAASGVSASEGSPINNAAEIGKRGSYHALMDMFNGQSEATGLQNQAKGVEYSGDIALLEGQQKKIASKYAAAGTLASTAGSMFSTYGKLMYPTASGKPGVNLD